MTVCVNVIMYFHSSVCVQIITLHKMVPSILHLSHIPSSSTPTPPACLHFLTFTKSLTRSTSSFHLIGFPLFSPSLPSFLPLTFFLPSLTPCLFSLPALCFHLVSTKAACVSTSVRLSVAGDGVT